MLKLSKFQTNFLLTKFDPDDAEFLINKYKFGYVSIYTTGGGEINMAPSVHLDHSLSNEPTLEAYEIGYERFKKLKMAYAIKPFDYLIIDTTTSVIYPPQTI